MSEEAPVEEAAEAEPAPKAVTSELGKEPSSDSDRVQMNEKPRREGQAEQLGGRANLGGQDPQGNTANE